MSHYLVYNILLRHSMFICMQVSFRADYSQLESLVDGKGVEFNFILPTIVF